MKKLLLGLSALTALLHPVKAELDVPQIDEMIDKIQKKRVSNVGVDFQKVPSPFVVVKIDKDNNKTVLSSPEEKIRMKAYAIIDDGTAESSVNINGRWLRIKDKINGYTVVEIKDNKTVLKKGDNTMELFLPKNPVEMEIPQIKITRGKR